VYKCAYTISVSFEWDPKKVRDNFEKHGVHFADAVAVLEDESALTINDSSSEQEERWITVGVDCFGRVLTVIYAWRGRRIRMISARPATSRERRQYEEEL
jgi:uncharacterized protein